MSLAVETIDGKRIDTQFIHRSEGPPTVQIGQHEMTLEHFSVLATHFLAGGFHGWNRNQIPEPICQALTELSHRYENLDGQWVLKDALP